LALFALAQVVFSLSAQAQPLTAVTSDPGNLTIKLEPVVNLNGFFPIDAATIPGDSRLYVGTYIASSASVQIVDPVAKTVSGTPFLTFAGTGVPITGYGLQGITFSPNFNDDSQPGYRKFYTYEVETGPGAGNIMYPHPERAAPAEVGVLREWTANAAGTEIDTNIPSRVVLNFGGPSANTHNGGGLKFGPDGYLYLSTGDGGGNGNGGSTTSDTDGFTGRNPSGTSNDVPAISNGEDFTNPLGAVVRIDPYVNNADGSPRATPADATAKEFDGATRYFIPDSNPFVGNPQNIYFTPLGPASSHTPVAPLGEIFAYGFRNPWKLSFDKNALPGDTPYVADVGSHEREEIDLLEAGKNYGWPYREGDIASGAANGRPLVAGNLPYLKETSPGVFAQFDLDPTLSDPTQMSIPLVRLGTQSISGGQFWDRPGQDYFNDGLYGDEWGDTSSVTGGFVYRGTSIPELQGMYVFGGYETLIRANTTNYVPKSAGGRLFYFDPDSASTIREFNFEVGSEIPANGGGNIFSISQGDDGELYVMFGNGDIKLLAAPTLPGDYNGDHVVNAADYTVWRNNLGTTAVLPNDPIGGEIGTAQYDQWKNNFGEGNSGVGSAAGVPEPGTLSLVVLGLLGWMTPIRRRLN
jgi:glucose/arabinose dehydrogenase